LMLLLILRVILRGNQMILDGSGEGYLIQTTIVK